MSGSSEFTPLLSDSLVPPCVLGTAALTTAAMQGMDLNALARLIDVTDSDPSAQSLDHSILHQLALRRDEAFGLQRTALNGSALFRIRSERTKPGTIRLLAIMAPGDLMVNTPLDFITAQLDIRLDILFLIPGRPLPAVLPDHDVAFMAISEADPALLDRLRHLQSAWPRPLLNHPASLPALARDRLPHLLAAVPELCCPATVEIGRSTLAALQEKPGLLPSILPGADFPLLARPVGSHAGAGLEKLGGSGELAGYLQRSTAASTYLTQFQDYKSGDGLYRKYRVVFIERQPYLCHLAISEHWMVHYLNAGMTESAEKRCLEASAMASFDEIFARRHSRAFAAICDHLQFDVFSIDCGELADGRLILFEADTAAIIHGMDSTELFPYKQPQMKRIFKAFGNLLRRRAGPAGLN